MYHPDHMLRIAHDREAELVREAEVCGVPQRAKGHSRLFGWILTAGAIAILILLPLAL
ncbi:MAG: hypothetical protein ACT4QE_22325 [Anaerolineales bacterium]